MKSVLFVDDDQNVLAGLRRMLRPLRTEWTTEFVDGGEKALAYMAENPVDVIVTDMRMPGMDGVQLLEQVVIRHPSAVRIALSGHSDQEMLIKVAGLAHHYLSKPCDTETLKSTVRRSLTLRDHFQNKTIGRLVARVQSLPSLPNNYHDILHEIGSPEPSLTRVANIISRDAAMTAKVLQLVNSAFFGTARRVSARDSRESKRQSSTRVACSEKIAKFTPPLTQVAPSGDGRPGQSLISACRDRAVSLEALAAKVSSGGAGTIHSPDRLTCVAHHLFAQVL